MYIRCFYKMIIGSPEVEFPWRASRAGMREKVRGKVYATVDIDCFQRARSEVKGKQIAKMFLPLPGAAAARAFAVMPDARGPECPRSVRAESGDSQECPAAHRVSLESFYAVRRSARLSECPGSLRWARSLPGVSGTPGMSLESFSLAGAWRAFRSVLGVSVRPGGSRTVPGISGAPGVSLETLRAAWRGARAQKK